MSKPNLLSMAALLIASLLASSVAVAEAPSVMEEIIVTAKFRDTGVLDTAGSIGIVDAATIARREAKHLEEVLNHVPNVPSQST